MSDVTLKKFVRTVDDVRFRKFSPIDRESPIFEVLFEETMIMDIARSDGNDIASEINVVFYKEIANVFIPGNVLREIVAKGERAIAAEEA